jgi:hypothetical protein
MKKLLKTASIIANLLFGCWACIEIYPIKPNDIPGISGSRPGSTTVCQAPSIEENIVGTWHFESTYNTFRLDKPDTVTHGTVTFTGERTIIDPDSLFESTLVGLPVTSKSYAPVKPYSSVSFTGNVFEVTLKTKKDGFQIDRFMVVSNECNRIHLRQFVSAANGIGFVLTRL